MTTSIFPRFLLALSFALTSCATNGIRPGTTESFWGSSCEAPLTLEQVEPIVEAGLCKSNATLIGKPVCDDWHRFLSGTFPTINPGGYLAGGAVGIEMGKSGGVGWSKGPIHVLYNNGQAHELGSVRLTNVIADNPAEQQEALRYLTSIYSGHSERHSSIGQYIEIRRQKAQTFSVRSDGKGVYGIVAACVGMYIRNGGDRTYALITTKGTTHFEPDAHPFMYFLVLTPQ